MNKIFKHCKEIKHINELESYYLFNKIIKNQVPSRELLKLLTNMDLDQVSIYEIIGSIKAFQKYVKFFPQPNYPFADIVGTGGDNVNLINVSTMSAIVASSFGLKIIKHCNTGISSKIGSADILKKMKINIHINSKLSKKQLNKNHICFLYAPLYHIGFQSVSDVRKKIKNRTIFNLIGPLLNPSYPNFAIVGVYSKNLLINIAQVIHHLNYERVFIIHSDGIDEITLHDETHIIEIHHGKILKYKLTPEDFGVKKIQKDFFINDNKVNNLNIYKNLFNKNGIIEYQYLIAVNTAILFKLFGYEDLKKNTKIIIKKIQSGEINNHIKKLNSRA